METINNATKSRKERARDELRKKLDHAIAELKAAGNDVFPLVFSQEFSSGADKLNTLPRLRLVSSPPLARQILSRVSNKKISYVYFHLIGLAKSKRTNYEHHVIDHFDHHGHMPIDCGETFTQTFLSWEQ